MSSLEATARNVRQAARLLAKSPTFTLPAVITLGLAMGANTAMFSVVKAVMLTPLPYGEPGRLVMLWNEEAAGERTWLSLPEVISYRDDTRSFASVGGYIEADANLTGGGEPERVRSAVVTGELFQTLSVDPLLGRTIEASDTHPGAAEIVVISHALWHRRFGGAADVVGQTLHVNGQPRTVAGIMPPSFRMPLDFGSERRTDVWLPQVTNPANLGGWGNRSYLALARLAPSVSADTATSELRVVADRWIRAGFVHDQGDSRLYRSALPIGELITGNIKRPLLILLATVAAVLVIACANVINLLLARADTRRREMAVRAALGADRRDLVRQLLSESAVLSCLSAAAGIVLARVAMQALITLRPAGLPRVAEASLDVTVLAWTAALALVVAVTFGLVPALQLSPNSLATVLNETARGVRGQLRRHVRRGLVVAQVAFSAVLIVAAVLLFRSLIELNRVDLGFNAHGVLTAQLQLPATEYSDSWRVNGFYRELIDRLSQVPGVTSAGAVRILPLSRTIGDWSIQIEGRPSALTENPNGDFQYVTPGYFEAMGMSLVRGRWFNAADREGAPPVVIVNDTMAARYWPGTDPLGKRFRMGGPDSTRPFMTIVGMVKTSRHNAILEQPRAEMYLPHAQVPESSGSIGRGMAVVLRTTADPRAMSDALRDTVRALDRNLPVAEIRTMDEVTGAALAAPRFASLLLGLFALLAATLAAIGTHAVISLLVAERAHEIGIRMALGAERRTILGAVLREGLIIAAAGLLLGVAGAVLFARMLGSLLYGVEALDSVTFGAVPTLLLAITLLASLTPARRAASIDPARALRQ